MADNNFSINTSDLGIISNDLDLPNEMFDLFGDNSTQATEEPTTPSEPSTEEIKTKDTAQAADTIEDIIADIDLEAVPVADTPQEPTEPDTTDTQENEFMVISKGLLESGVFSESEEPLPETPEQFVERFQKEKIKGANEQLTKFLSQFGQDYMDAFRAIYINGVNPKEYFQIGAQSENILNLDMEQEANQKKITKKYYMEVSGLSEARAEKMLQSVIEDGELDSEANMALTKFKEQHESKLAAVEQAKIQDQERRAQEKQYFNHHVTQFLQTKKDSKDFDGLKFNDDISMTVQRNLTQPAYKLPNGELITEFQKFIMELSNPENIETAIKIALLRENDFDFSKIQAKKAKEEQSSIWNSLKKQTQRQSNTQSKPVDGFTL